MRLKSSTLRWCLKPLAVLWPSTIILSQSSWPTSSRRDSSQNCRRTSSIPLHDSDLPKHAVVDAEERGIASYPLISSHSASINQMQRKDSERRFHPIYALKRG